MIFLLIAIYTTYRFNKITAFFVKYVKNSNGVSDTIAKSYTSISIFIALLILITFSVLMYLLMKRKQKPYKFYLFTGIYCIIIFISVIYARNTMLSLTTATLTSKAARAYRDIYQLLLLPNFCIIALSFIRAIGFDVKKFNFSKDLEELEIKSEDNEEFEFVLGNNSYKIKRKVRRYLREFKYYFQENKLFISIILSSIFLVSFILILLNVTFFNHVYKIGETLKTSSFTYTLNNAYLTSYDYSGKKIKEDKKYLILDFSIKSNGNATAINPEEFYLKLKNEIINYKTTLSTSFSDLGTSYKNDKISDLTNYIFVFEINDEDIKKSYTLNVFNKKTYLKDGSIDYDYKTYKIKPNNIDKEYIRETKSLNETISLNKSIFGNTSLTIKNIKVVSSYEYSYQNCDENNSCTSYYNVELPTNTTQNNLMVINYDLNIDEESPIYRITGSSAKKFFDSFLKITYTSNNINYETKISTKINNNVDNTLFIDVSKSLKNVQNTSLNISTRYENYSIAF
jgi:hypothetical protein